jgi:hypothetical protein
MIKIRIRKPAAGIAKASVSQGETLILKYMSAQRIIYGPRDVKICRMLDDNLGLLYFVTMLCQEISREEIAVGFSN